MATLRRAPRDWIETAPLSDSLRALARRGIVAAHPKGRLLIQEGATDDAIHIVLDGRVRVFGSSLASGREITYGTYGPGEYHGEMSLDGGTRSASVETIEPTVCSMVTRHTLLAHLREDPDFALELLAKVIRRARAATLSAKNIALNDVYGRLKELLEALAAVQPDGTRRIAERPTQQEIANRLGCSREMVTRLLKDLQNGGYIAVSRDGIVLLRALPPRW